MISFLRQLVFEDFWLKLFSLVLAILIWVTISLAIKKEVSPVPTPGQPTVEKTFFNLPVVILSSAEDVRNFKVNPKEVEVTVQGEAKLLQSLSSKDIRVMVDLTGIEAGHVRRRVQVSTPAGVTHVHVSPQEVEVIFPSKA